VARPATGCDIGAFESQGFTLSVVDGDQQAGTVGTAFAAPLEVQVIAVAAGEPVQGGVVSFSGPYRRDRTGLYASVERKRSLSTYFTTYAI
jgi:hypothetical protein